MEIQFGPNSVDEPNLLYKLQRKIKVFNTNDPLPNRGYNLVASSSKYGLVFVAVPDGVLTVYHVNQLIDNECEPQHLTVQLQEKPTHIAVSCDSELLAVTGGQLLSVYKVAEFQNSDIAPSITLRTEINLSTFVVALQWNPCIPDSIAIAFYDGTLFACHLLTGQTKKVPSKARCICWSPKGKQLVTGNSDGTLMQYKPDLTPAKIVPAPNLFEGSPVEALAIYWISTFQFAVVVRNAADNSRPALTIINTPKTGQPSCLNYEDICYSMGSNRPWYYFLQGLAQWNVILSASSNSMEIATLASADGVNWQQWCQSDEARPELPLTDKKQENYPVGISLDTCAVHQLPWGENETLPHMPLLHVLSQTGLLTIFNVINLKKEVPQVCVPPVQVSLPAHVMSSAIPGEVPPEPVALQQPAAVPKSEPQVSLIQQALQTPAPQPTNQFGSTVNAPIKVPTYQPQTAAFAAAPVQVPEQKPIVENKPAPIPQPQAAVPHPKPQPAPVPPKPQPTPQQIQENAAIKAEQEKVSKMKANQEMKNMLVKEVNDFQKELYNFMLKTRETQAKLQRDIDTMNTNFNGTSLDAEKLRKECSVEELRGAIVQLKLELVRACAVVAEARTHSDTKHLHQWSQADPLTTKRIASVKKLAYYVQTQLDQAHKALDRKWNELTSRDSHFNKPSKRMTRPILDDVYQPLVKQQEILGRQQAVIRTLKNTLSECDEETSASIFRSMLLLRTPFKRKDALSKLTKNVLNMSIEPGTKKKSINLSGQKLDALRDVLSNHKTIKIKPVNVEMRHHLATLRQSYEESLKEKAQVPVMPDYKPQVQDPVAQITNKIEMNPNVIQQTVSAPAFTPVTNIKPAPGLTNVARTLFTDEPKQQLSTPQSQMQAPPPKTYAFSGPTTTPPTTADAKTVLKDLLTTKQANLEAKKNANNLFMGQKICSPTSFAQASLPIPSSTPSLSSAPSSVFSSKPIADINNMVNKFQPQPFVPETKPLATKSNDKLPNVKSSETGEPEESIPKAFEFKPKDKPISNLFGMKSLPLASSTPNVPDVLKSSIQDKVIAKPSDKSDEKAKENVPEKSSETVPKVAPKVTAEKKESKPLSAQTANKGFVFGASQPSVTTSAATSSSDLKPLDLKTENKSDTKVAEKCDATEKHGTASVSTSDNSSVTTPKLQAPSTPPLLTPKTETPTEKSSETETKATDSTPSTATASSVFGAAVASQPKTTSSIFSAQSSSIFSPTSQSSVFGTTTTSSVFGTATSASSVFGQTNTTQSVFTSTAASIFASSSQPPTPTFGTATTTATSSVFSSTPVTTTPSVFATTTTAASVFASTPTPTFGTTADSGFGANPPSPSSVFAPTTTPSLSSVFGTTPTTQSPVFGASTTAASVFSPTTTSLFGTATTTASIFATSPSQASSVFGQASQSVFGATTQASIFGSTAQTSVFGSPSTQSSVFGSPTQTTQASVFGTPTQSTQSSIFGTPTAATQASVFGTPPQANQGSVFGSPQTTQGSSIFGSQPATTAAQSSMFGGGEANLFAAASISTTSAPSQASGGNIFGGSTSGSVFGGGNTNVFGGSAAFGQSNQAATSIFGGGGGASFGQKPASSIWGSGGNTTGGFGSSGFGQQATTQSSSIFGGGTGGSFSAPSAGAFGSTQQTSPFGSPQQQAPAGAFGGSPVFGNKPVFGQSTGFGSPTNAGFGAPAAFGGFNKSPGGGFGSSGAFSGGSGFGGGGSPGGFAAAAAQSNATFENLATQNTLTFGNLAQQSTHQPAPSFNTSPSFTGWRG